jgi:hypothetical protein
MIDGMRTTWGKEQTDRADACLIAIFFSLDFFQQLFSRLTLDAELRKRHGFQSPLTDLHATLRADAVGAFVEPRQGFIDGLASSIPHFHQGNAQLAIKIHEGLIADVARRFKPSLFIFNEGLAQTPLDFFDDFLALPHQHLLKDVAAAFPVFAFFASFTGTLAFATGFFLAGVFVAMADPAPRFHIKQLKKVRHS